MCEGARGYDRLSLRTVVAAHGEGVGGQWENAPILMMAEWVKLARVCANRERQQVRRRCGLARVVYANVEHGTAHMALRVGALSRHFFPPRPTSVPNPTYPVRDGGDYSYHRVRVQSTP